MAFLASIAWTPGDCLARMQPDALGLHWHGLYILVLSFLYLIPALAVGIILVQAKSEASWQRRRGRGGGPNTGGRGPSMVTTFGGGAGGACWAGCWLQRGCLLGDDAEVAGLLLHLKTIAGVVFWWCWQHLWSLQCTFDGVAEVQGRRGPRGPVSWGGSASTGRGGSLGSRQPGK